MIKMTFLGDIMCDLSMACRFKQYQDENGAFDFHSVFSPVEHLLKESDIVIANLETPISIDNSDLTYKASDFNSPIEFAQAVKDCGIDVVSTANNHCLDRGLKGLKSTIDSLNQVGIKHCGVQIEKKKRHLVLQVGSLKIGMLAYTYGTNAFANHFYLSNKHITDVNLLQEQEGRVKQLYNRLFHGRFQRIILGFEHILFPQNRGKQVFERETLSFFQRILILRDIRQLRREYPDLMIACLHVGGQLNQQPSLYTKRITEWFIKKGFSMVIDNHEHVIHGMSLVNGSIATYALGDFLSGVGVRYAPFDRHADYSVALHVYVDEIEKKVKKLSFSLMKRICRVGEKIEVWPADQLLSFDCYRVSEDEILSVAKQFSGKDYSSVSAEYCIFE